MAECGYTCKYTCSENCTGSCMATCSGGCTGACSSTCSDSCYADCTGTCSGTCSGGCWGGCLATCDGTCSGECSGACSSACSTDCTGTCSTTCADNCYSSCTDSCSGSCDGTCIGGCSGGCYTTCTENCADNCTGTCESQSAIASTLSLSTVTLNSVTLNITNPNGKTLNILENTQPYDTVILGSSDTTYALYGLSSNYLYLFQIYSNSGILEDSETITTWFTATELRSDIVAVANLALVTGTIIYPTSDSGLTTESAQIIASESGGEWNFSSEAVLDCQAFTASVYLSVLYKLYLDPEYLTLPIKRKLINLQLNYFSGATSGADAQAYLGTTVEFSYDSETEQFNESNLMLGDLVILDKINDQDNIGNHVLIYIGNGQMIDCRSAGVSLTEFTDNWSSYGGKVGSLVMAVRRIIQDDGSINMESTK